MVTYYFIFHLYLWFTCCFTHLVFCHILKVLFEFIFSWLVIKIVTCKLFYIVVLVSHIKFSKIFINVNKNFTLYSIVCLNANLLLWEKNILYNFLLSHIIHICTNFNVDMMKECVWIKTKVMAMVHAQGGHFLYIKKKTKY